MRLSQTTYDEIDVRLLDLLQADADRTLRDYGDDVGLSPSAVQRRLKRYKAVGLLRTAAVLDATRAGPLPQAIVMVTLKEETLHLHASLKKRLAARPEVQQCYALTGRWDYAVILTAPSVTALRDLGNALFKADDNIRRFDTMVVLDPVKTGAAIPAQLLIG